MVLQLHRPLPVLEQGTFVPISGLLDLLLCLPEMLHPHLFALLASGVSSDVTITERPSQTTPASGGSPSPTCYHYHIFLCNYVVGCITT